MKKISLIAFVLISISSLAEAKTLFFQLLYQGHKLSDQVKNLDYQFQMEDYQNILNQAQYSQKMNMKLGYSDLYPASLYTFQSQQTIKNELSLSYSIPTYELGHLNFDIIRREYDLSKWAMSSLSTLADDEASEYLLNMNYQINLLNRSGKYQWKNFLISKNNHEARWSRAKEEQQYQFFQAYLQAKFVIILSRLYQAEQVKNQERIQTLKKRVADGLGRKTDLNQAWLVFYNQEEIIIKNNQDCEEKISHLENALKVKIDPSYYNELTWEMKKYSHEDFVSQEFPDLKLLKVQNENQYIQSLINHENTGTQLNLSLGYRRNAFDTQDNTAWKKALHEGRNEEKMISLELTYPLDQKQKSARIGQIQYLESKNKLQESMKESELNVEKDNLLRTLLNFHQLLKNSEQKVQIARKNVEAYQQQYLLGQVSFEENLRAADVLSQAQKARLNNLMGYELNMAKWAYLHGRIVDFLENYKE